MNATATSSHNHQSNSAGGVMSPPTCTACGEALPYDPDVSPLLVPGARALHAGCLTPAFAPPQPRPWRAVVRKRGGCRVVRTFETYEAAMAWLAWSRGFDSRTRYAVERAEERSEP